MTLWRLSFWRQWSNGIDDAFQESERYLDVDHLVWSRKKYLFCWFILDVAIVVDWNIAILDQRHEDDIGKDMSVGLVLKEPAELQICLGVDLQLAGSRSIGDITYIFLSDFDTRNSLHIVFVALVQAFPNQCSTIVNLHRKVQGWVVVECLGLLNPVILICFQNTFDNVVGQVQ